MSKLCCHQGLQLVSGWGTIYVVYVVSEFYVHVCLFPCRWDKEAVLGLLSVSKLDVTNPPLCRVTVGLLGRGRGWCVDLSVAVG